MPSEGPGRNEATKYKSTRWFGFAPAAGEKTGGGERRAAFRLSLNHLSPIDGSLVTRGGSVVAALIHDLSAGGLRCQVFEPEPFSKGQPLLFICALPHAGRTILKTEALTVHHAGRAEARSQTLGLCFAEFIDPASEDTLHRFILEKQLESRRERQREEAWE